MEEQRDRGWGEEYYGAGANPWRPHENPDYYPRHCPPPPPPGGYGSAQTGSPRKGPNPVVQIAIAGALFAAAVWVVRSESMYSHGECVRIDPARLETPGGCIAALKDMAEFPHGRAVFWRRAFIGSLIGGALSLGLLQMAGPDIGPGERFLLIFLPTFLGAFFVTNHHNAHGYPRIHNEYAQYAERRLRDFGLPTCESPEQWKLTEQFRVLHGWNGHTPTARMPRDVDAVMSGRIPAWPHA